MVSEMSLNGLKTELERAEKDYENAEERLGRAKRAISTYGVENHLTGPEHYCTIYVRGCDTTRECNCLYGEDHNEYETPLMWNGKKF